MGAAALAAAPSIISAGSTILGAKGQANALGNQANIQNKSLEEQQREFNLNRESEQARKSAYESSLSAGRNDLSAFGGKAETAFDSASPELAQMKKDIETNNATSLQQGAGQMSANLESAGVRGGQAATLLNRGTGEQSLKANQDVNTLIGNEAQQREAEKRAYLAALAQRGQAASLNPGGF